MKGKTKDKNFTIEEILKAIDGSFGIVSTIAEELKCNWRTAKKYIDMYDETKAAMEDEQEKALDMAENTIMTGIQMTNTQDAKWYLSKKGKARGYGDELAITGKDGSNLFPALAGIEIKQIGIDPEFDADPDA